MKILGDREMTWITNHKNMPLEVRNTFLLAYEYGKVIEILNKEKDAYNMCNIAEILEVIVNNPEAIKTVSEYIYEKYEKDKFNLE